MYPVDNPTDSRAIVSALTEYQKPILSESEIVRVTELNHNGPFISEDVYTIIDWDVLNISAQPPCTAEDYIMCEPGWRPGQSSSITRTVFNMWRRDRMDAKRWRFHCEYLEKNTECEQVMTTGLTKSEMDAQIDRAIDEKKDSRQAR